MNQKERKEYDKAYYEENKEKILIRGKKYRENNKEKRKEYREENKEKILIRGKEYREKNKEKIKEYDKAYYENNKEKRKEYDKARYEKNKEKIRNKDYYIKRLLIGNSDLKADDIPPELFELKKMLLTLKRELKNGD